MNSFRNFRLIPVVLAGIVCLAGLKITGLVLHGGYIFTWPAKQMSWAQDMFNYPSGGPKNPTRLADITGSVEAKKQDAAKSEKKSETSSGGKDEIKPAEAQRSSEQSVVTPDQNRPVSASERAILERLQERRQELEARAREIDIRESLIKAAEKRIGSKVEEIKAVEARAGAMAEQKNNADTARFKSIVTMYEAMKPKDAARIFDRLDMAVLIEVASQIAPRKMSDIVGFMQPEAAERLTVEMARRAGGDQAAALSNLPKIEGRSNTVGSY